MEVERRRHRVYVTRNTEYHLRDGVCVAVRDRRSRAFLRAHLAEGLRLESFVHAVPQRGVLPEGERAEVGEALFFLLAMPEGGDRHVVTSRVERLERATKGDVAGYPGLR